MRVLAGALLAVLAAGPDPKGAGGFAVTVDARPQASRPQANPCAVVSTGTIVAYDASTAREVAYRFVRSDGSVSRAGRLAFAGDGAVAQSVREEWTPRGSQPWIVLEITAPEHVRSSRVAVVPRCPRRVAAAPH